MAYEVEVTGNVAHGCGCLAGLNDDPLCQHRAAFYLVIGALSLDPEPGAPAPAAPVVCYRRRGVAVGCLVCDGAGAASRAAQAAALCAFADAETCDKCGCPLNEDSEWGDALTVCGACVEEQQAAAGEARQAAIAANHGATVREAEQLVA